LSNVLKRHYITSDLNRKLVFVEKYLQEVDTFLVLATFSSEGIVEVVIETDAFSRRLPNC